MTIMKSKAKQPTELMDDPQSKKLLESLEDQDKHVLNGLSEKNHQGEELIQRQEVNNTPFMIITINNESFGTFGKYRITEMYHTKAQCEAELKRIDWNRIIQIIALTTEMLKDNKSK